MKTKLLFLFIVVSTLLISCSSDDDSSETSTFQGEWSGTFEGDDSGTWEATINGNGNLSGEFISINFSEGFTVLMTGNVNSEGEVQATYDHQFLSGTFTGVLSSETGSGTWTNDEDGSNGTWAGTKN